jgi:predicted ATPase/DNA-binding SARP family transcriptional activator
MVVMTASRSHAKRVQAGLVTLFGVTTPISLTSLVGREDEIRDLEALLKAQRLVTLTGTGGAGKTRLASELALRLEWQRADSVAWVDLAAANEGHCVVQETAAAIALRSVNEADVIDALRDRELLLVFDNCEQIIGACAELARTLLVRAPRLRILTTSREPLGVAGEHVWPLPPIAPHEAVQLFAERAAAVDPAFAMNDENRAAIAEICARLDGIPLAIELAAARIRVLTPSQIAAKLEDRFAILTAGARATVPRHRTLRAAIDWSFALLSEREQTLLAQLSVFAGSFSLEAAEAVCGADLDLLTGLVDKSLVTTSRSRSAVRYRLLDTLRHYAAERLAERGETEALRRKHALAFVEIARNAVVDPMDAVLAQLASLDAEHDNVRAALAWSLEHEPDAIALPLGAAFRWYWYYRILWSEGLRWLRRVVERSSSASSPERAAALAGAGTFAAYSGDLASGRVRLEEAESMWRELGDDRNLALTLSALAQVLANEKELDAATARAEESVALARVAGTCYDVAYCLTNATAFVAQRRGDLEAADHALEEAESLWAPVKHPLGLPFVLSTRALLAARRGDLECAERRARATLDETRPRRDLWFSARALRVLAFTATDDPSRAARLLGAAEAMLTTIGARVPAHEKQELESLMAKLPASELEAGRALSFDEACDLALAPVERRALSPPALHVRDLGPLRITLAGKPLEDRGSNRARELLVFLLAHPHGPAKEEVGVAFWPDATGEQVKNAFHVTLHRLRKLLGDSDAIVAEGARYRVAIPHVLDSQLFESEINDALRQKDAVKLESALALYAGDFMQGEECGDWIFAIRSRLSQLHVRGLFALGQAHESRGRQAEAAEVYARLLGCDPFHEQSARRLMICRARLGARSESLMVYRQLEQRLREDLQATPEPETSTLYQRLRQNEAV